MCDTFFLTKIHWAHSEAEKKIVLYLEFENRENVAIVRSIDVYEDVKGHFVDS